MSVFDVQHQPTAQAIVQQALLTGRLAHGLLLVGPSGVGKEMLATRLAGLLLCPSPAEVADGPGRAGLVGQSVPAWLAPPTGAAWHDACGQCEDCRLLAAGAHPDVHMVYRELFRFIPELKERKGLELYIEVIREFLIGPSASKSVRGRGKLFIVRDAHLMSDEAQNALLKTLEEPPAGTFLVLLTDQAHLLLETIRSRCQLVRFNPLPAEFVRARLTGLAVNGRTVGPDEAAYLAGRCGGQLGVALRMAGEDLFGLHQELAARLAALTTAGAIDLADWLEEQINQLSGERVQREGITESQAKKDVACELLATASLVLADAIHSAAGVGSEPMLPATAGTLARGPDPSARMDRLARGVEALARAEYLIAVRFVNLRLALDEAAVTLAAALAG